MTKENLNHTNCQEIMLLLNELIDGEMDTERAHRALKMIENNPNCQAIYQTLLKTIDLYRQRKNEMKAHKAITFNFEQSPLESKE
jgi:hypothetical protein